MDDQVTARLRAQEEALRDVAQRCAHIRTRVAETMQSAEWRGPASEAYRNVASALEGQLCTAHIHLLMAANDTAAAIFDPVFAPAEVNGGG